MEGYGLSSIYCAKSWLNFTHDSTMYLDEIKETFIKVYYYNNTLI